MKRLSWHSDGQHVRRGVHRGQAFRGYLLDREHRLGDLWRAGLGRTIF